MRWPIRSNFMKFLISFHDQNKLINSLRPETCLNRFITNAVYELANAHLVIVNGSLLRWHKFFDYRLTQITLYYSFIKLPVECFILIFLLSSVRPKTCYALQMRWSHRHNQPSCYVELRGYVSSASLSLLLCGKGKPDKIAVLFTNML